MRQLLAGRKVGNVSDLLNKWLVAIVVLLAAIPAFAQQATRPAQVTPAGVCQLSSLTSATLLSSCSGGIPVGTQLVLASVEVANVRYRDDGTAPTTSIGVQIYQGQTLTYNGNLAAIQFIAVSGSPVINVAFYKYVGG